MILHTHRVRHTEFWARMNEHLGPGYAESWAQDQHLPGLEDRTVLRSLADGEPPKRVWRVVCDALQLGPEAY